MYILIKPKMNFWVLLLCSWHCKMLHRIQTPINKADGASDPKLTYSVGGKDNSKLFYHCEQPALHMVVTCSHALMLFHIQTLYICPLK